MEILETLRKVEKSLDLRFEKDTTLYISKQDTELLKKNLANSNFQNIITTQQRLGNKVVVKVIIKNSWLVKLNTKNRDYLKRIFDVVDKNFLKEILEDLIEDRIFSTLEFKRFVEPYYYYNIESSKCEKIYKNSKKYISVRAICFLRYLKELYLKNNPENHLVLFVNQEFEIFPEIYDYFQHHYDKALNSVFENLHDKYSVSRWIIDHKIIDRHDKLWKNLFISLGEAAFEEAIEHIKNNLKNDDVTKLLIKKHLKYFCNVSSFEEDIVSLYRKNPHLRKLLIYMLEPDKFINKELGLKLIDIFEQIGVPNNMEDEIKTIKRWEEKKKNFTSLDEVKQELSENNQDFDNPKTVAYFSSKFFSSDKNLVLEVYNELGNEENVKKVLSYYFAQMSRNRFIPTVYDFTPEYIDMIGYYMLKLNMNTTFSIKFLEKHNKTDVIVKLKSR